MMSEVEEVLKDSSASFWLKEAIKALDNRDIVDALSDIECLEKIFRAKKEFIIELIKERAMLKKNIYFQKQFNIDDENKKTEIITTLKELKIDYSQELLL